MLSDTTQRYDEQAIELEENVAYGPVSVSWTLTPSIT